MLKTHFTIRFISLYMFPRLLLLYSSSDQKVQIISWNKMSLSKYALLSKFLQDLKGVSERICLNM